MSKSKRSLRYPRKLRQTLEKIKTGAEQLATLENGLANDDPDGEFRMLWHHFLDAAGGVHFMHSRIDEVAHKLVTDYYLFEPEPIRLVRISAPWIAEPEREP